MHIVAAKSAEALFFQSSHAVECGGPQARLAALSGQQMQAEWFQRCKGACFSQTHAHFLTAYLRLDSLKEELVCRASIKEEGLCLTLRVATKRVSAVAFLALQIGDEAFCLASRQNPGFCR